MRVEGYDFSQNISPVQVSDSTQQPVNNLQIQRVKTNDPESKSFANPNKIITKNERDFFISMFPDSSDQLSRHVVFNRNGKIQTSSFSKGILVDAVA